MAGQGLDHRAPHQVVGSDFDAAHYRQQVMVEPVVILVQGAHVLAVGRADFSDRRHAQPDQVAVAIGRVALEIAVQPPLALRHRQVVVRLGEMVHADVDIARGEQRLDRIDHELQLDLRLRHVGIKNAPLRLEHCRQMRVVVERDAVRRALDHLGERVAETRQGLLRQAVDQIDIDRLEAVLARRFDHLRGFFHALDAVDGALDFGVEVLHADADAVHAQRAQQRHLLLADLARIHLDRILAVRIELEALAYHLHQLGEFGLAEERRRAAAPMHLRHAPPPAQLGALQANFPAQILQVLG